VNKLFLSLSVKYSISQIADHVYLFHGAGEAGVGIADLVAEKIHIDTGLSLEESRSRIWLVDSRGLITSDRDLSKLEHHKLPYAHSIKALSKGSSPSLDLLSAIQLIKPTALVGVSAQGGSFTEEVVREMSRLNEHPVIFALSNPTSKSECTAEQAYRWSDGRAVFASGSPFAEVTYNGRLFVPGQGNNA
jgi:malate dehydrogenase (oxaloacetate-decarboxylating)(NADP+)